MSAVNAGRVLIIPKGAWNAQTEYQMLDSVHYHGSMYIAKRANQNITPVDGDDWFLSAEGTQSGANVESFNNRTGNVTPQANDYDISQISSTGGTVGQVPVVKQGGGFELADPDKGHIILDPSGNELKQRQKLKFTNATVQDDAQNGSTLITVNYGTIPVNPQDTTNLNIWIEDVQEENNENVEENNEEPQEENNEG